MKKTGTTRKVGRYQQKARKGLVPHQYDRHSKSYQRGAHRYWPSDDRSTPACRKIAENDRKFLEMAREAR